MVQVPPPNPDMRGAQPFSPNLRRHGFARLRMLRAMTEQLEHQEALMEERVRSAGIRISLVATGQI